MKTTAIKIPKQLFKRNNSVRVTPRNRALYTVNWFLNGKAELHHQPVLNKKDS